MSRTASQRHPKTGHNPAQPDGSLQLALTQLDNAICDLTNPRTAQTPDGRPAWVADRYTTLRQELYDHSGTAGHLSKPSSVLPCWSDALKLLITCDTRTTTLTGISARHHTAIRLQNLTRQRWRPQDSAHLNTIAAEIQSWVKAIDDLFSPKPVYLPDKCPHCGFDHAYRLSDEGERVRVPALTLTVEHGASCASCHDIWRPDMLPHLARLLGYQPIPGIIA